MIKAEVSLYPLNSALSSELAGLPAQFLNEHALDYDSYQGDMSLNSTISGDSEQVWGALKELFQQNKRLGRDLIMVTTLTHWD